MLDVTISQSNRQPIVNMAFAAGESISESIAISIIGPSPSTTATPLDITGYTFKMTIGFAVPLVLNTVNGGITTTDPVNGICQININDSTSGGFTPGAYPYDLWMLTGTTAIRLFNGTFTVLSSISTIP